MNITVIEVEGTELHHQYRGQNKPQPCHVSLDCESRTLTAGYDPEIGGAVPFAVHHGIVRRWGIPSLKEAAANALLAEIAPLAERVVAGYERTWDGNNHVGEYSEDAQEAIESIRDLCDRARADADEHSTVQVWDAGDWFGGIGRWEAQCEALGITAETTDDELRAIEAAAEVEAANNGVDVLNGVRDHLEWLREKADEAD